MPHTLSSHEWSPHVLPRAPWSLPGTLRMTSVFFFFQLTVAAPHVDAGVKGAADAADSHSAHIKGTGVPVTLLPMNVTFSNLSLIVVSLFL